MSTTPMPRKLGKNGPSVSAMGFGLMGMSHAIYGKTLSEEEIFPILDRALELGLTFWDTSDLYGDNEEVLGKWFQRTGKRNEIFLATKFGYVKGSPSYEINSSADYCKKACAESLKCLGIDCIDLYYAHNVNNNTPIEETMRALAELQREGKIKHIGLSTISSSTLRRAVKVAPVAAVQIEYSPFTLNIEGPSGTDLLATCRELGVAVVAQSPLGRGLLTSSFDGSSGSGGLSDDDMRGKMMPRFMEENRSGNEALVARFAGIARRKGCTTAQLALAWVMAQGEDVIPIPGTKKMKYLEENWAAADIKLSDADEKEIRKFLSGVEVAGDVVPAQFSDYVFRDTVEDK